MGIERRPLGPSWDDAQKASEREQQELELEYLKRQQGELKGKLEEVLADKKRAEVLGKDERDMLSGIAERLLKETEELEGYATKDKLTGLDNRRAFEEKMHAFASELRASGDKRRHGRERIAVMLLDIDHFKQFNDTYGHDVGDMVLQAIAADLKNRLRTADVVARWGGEEFVIAFPEANEEEILKLFGKDAEEHKHAMIEAVVRVRVNGSEQAFTVTMSGGITEHHSGEQLEDVMKRADQALYAAKHSGRNRILAAGDLP